MDGRRLRDLLWAGALAAFALGGLTGSFPAAAAQTINTAHLASAVPDKSRFPSRPPADVTATMDRDQMMWQLGVTFPVDLPPKSTDPNRPNIDLKQKFPEEPDRAYLDDAGNTIVRDAFGLWVNYDDSKAGLYTPLDLLKMHNGARVRTAADWRKRRAEIEEDVKATVWGRIPAAAASLKVKWEIGPVTTGGAGDIAYTDRTVTGIIDTSSYPEVRNAPMIETRLRLPADSKGPVPVIIVFGAPNDQTMNTNWEYVKREGWGIAAFNPTALQPDNGVGLTSYLIGLVNKGNWRKPDDWGTLVAYAWGIGRLLDHYETGREVDTTRIGLMGHSRWGKATMVVQAYEKRVLVSYPSAGGTLGAKQFRRHWGQNLESISVANEYHWMAGNAFKFMGPLRSGSYMPRKVELLPVDGESLIALAAPRPVFLNGGTTDTWSDAFGTYLAGVAASPVYELLGKKGVVNPDGNVPKPDVAYLQGDLGYRVHTGGHAPAPDWPAFVEFAKKYFAKPALRDEQ